MSYVQISRWALCQRQVAFFHMHSGLIPHFPYVCDLTNIQTGQKVTGQKIVSLQPFDLGYGDESDGLSRSDTKVKFICENPPLGCALGTHH